MKFTKMQGCGNDYVYVNGFTEKLSPEEKPEIVRSLSDRHFGIGGDGVIFINPAEEADFEMEMYNADGSRSEMCGNGIRCVGKYVYDNGHTDKERVRIETLAGILTLGLHVSGGKVEAVTVDMGVPRLAPRDIPVGDPGSDFINRSLRVRGRVWNVTAVSMGNPHAVVFTHGIGKLNLPELGPLFEHHPLFPRRTNAEFVEVIDRNTLSMRVWERGAGETLACGTGACASVVAAVLTGNADRKVHMKLLGGTLDIEWDEASGHVFMTGGAVTVFTGEYPG